MKTLFYISFFLVSILHARIDCEYMSHLQQRVIKAVYSKYDCSCCATGGGAFYDVDKIFLSFQFDQIPSDTQFRKMAIDIAGIFIDKINEDKIIRPYLRRYPASLSTIRLTFLFPHQKGEICSGGISGGRLHTSIESGEKYVYIDGLNEVYEEALRKVNAESGKL